MAKKTIKRMNKRDPERSRRNKRIAIVTSLALFGGAVFVAGAMGVVQLDRAAAREIVPSSPEVVINWDTLSDGSIWMPRDEQQRLSLGVARAVRGGRALSSSPLKEAVLALQGSGWVQGIPQARWTSDGQIMIDASWRIPAAAVRIGNREFIIDWDRFVLPLDYALGVSNQIYFVNADAPLPKVGQQWEGTDLQDGIALLRDLRAYNLLEQIAGLDLGRGGESGTITIITHRGTRIVFGAGPGRERPGEKPTTVKLNRMKALYEKTGLIDGSEPYIDIRGDDMMVNRNP